MADVICTTQTEVDAAAARGDRIIIDNSWRASSSAVLRGSSSAVLWGSSRAVLRASSSAVLRGSSSAVLWGRATAQLVGDNATATGPGAYRIRTAQDLADYDGLDIVDGCVTLYKALSADLTGGGGHGTVYPVGAVVTAPDWDPSSDRGCGGGLHLCLRPHDAHSHNRQATTIVACRVRLDDIRVYEPNLSKVRCREVEVLGVSHTVADGWLTEVTEVEA